MYIGPSTVGASALRQAVVAGEPPHWTKPRVATGDGLFHRFMAGWRLAG